MNDTKSTTCSSDVCDADDNVWQERNEVYTVSTLYDVLVQPKLTERMKTSAVMYPAFLFFWRHSRQLRHMTKTVSRT
jgi:hypothetical protein